MERPVWVTVTAEWQLGVSDEDTIKAALVALLLLPCRSWGKERKLLTTNVR